MSAEEELENIADKESLPAGVLWLRSRREFSVKRLRDGKPVATDRAGRFRVTMRELSSDPTVAVLSKRNAALAFWRGSDGSAEDDAVEGVGSSTMDTQSIDAPDSAEQVDMS